MKAMKTIAGSGTFLSNSIWEAAGRENSASPDFSLFPAGHHPCPARFVRLLVEEAQTSRETAIENGFPSLTTLGGKEVDNSGAEV